MKVKCLDLGQEHLLLLVLFLFWHVFTWCLSLLAGQSVDQRKGAQGHHQQEGEKYQVAVLKALPGRPLEPVKYPVGPEIQQDGRQCEVQDFHGCLDYYIAVKNILSEHLARAMMAGLPDMRRAMRGRGHPAILQHHSQ